MTGGRHQYTIQAKPRPIVFGADETAVLVIDMQNDFGAAGGMFDRAGIDISGIRRVVEPTRKVLQAAREAGLPIVYLTMEYEPDLSNLGAPGTPNRRLHEWFGVGQTVVNPDGRRGRVLIKGTWNTAVIDELAPQARDTIVSKHRYSGFFETRLDAVLQELGAKCLVVTGCTTSVCVESTIRDAMFRGYDCILLSDCSAEPIGANLPRSNHEATLLSIETLFGSVSDAGSFIDALRG